MFSILRKVHNITQSVVRMPSNVAGTNILLLPLVSRRFSTSSTFSYDDFVRFAAKGNLEKIQNFLSSEGFDINKQVLSKKEHFEHRPWYADKDEKYGALYIASTNGHLPVVKCLLDKGANINQPTSHMGRFPISGALERGHLGVALYLTMCGANPYVRDKVHQTLTALQIARNIHESTALYRDSNPEIKQLLRHHIPQFDRISQPSVPSILDNIEISYKEWQKRNETKNNPSAPRI